ncbi:MAG TPA: T9SS type A sorting domain-containing protein [Saprospiraceae bacterium]|nr:T9SS type A sorting domain-containing protein [Saprospiraceae bacterium]HMQ82768.1 T9SS type A sorting domain-containing protein [Saprospiraceae bacterium]
MQRISILTILLFSCILFLSNLDGAFPENTGAPGELTCGRQPCHNVAVNVGQALLSIEYSEASMTYMADSTYTLSVKIENQPTIRNGFQILALDENNQNTGSWQLSDPERMKIISGIGLPNRKYVTHTAAGNQQTEWTLDWKAPANNSGTVTFYASVNATNDNGLNTGDEVYTGSLAVAFTEPNAVAQPTLPPFQVYPNPAHAVVWVDIPAHLGHISINILDLNGATSGRFEFASGGLEALPIDHLPAGIYWIKMENEAGAVAARKVVVW